MSKVAPLLSFFDLTGLGVLSLFATAHTMRLAST